MLENIEPIKVFKYFEEISMIPHGSGNLSMIISYLVDFAKKRNLEYLVDDANNVIIKKKGNDKKDTIILQGHSDMVCVKSEDSIKDLTKDHIDIFVDGEWLKADKTSLGGDDGIAVAMILAILDDDNKDYPNIEALITADEETGLYGAMGLDGSKLSGKKLINIDSEEEGVFTVSCAGGVHLESNVKGKKENVEGTSYELRIHNLLGGHSGVDIHKNHANANIEMARCIYDMINNGFDIRLIDINGGNFDNVICQDSVCNIILINKNDNDFLNYIKKLDNILKNEYISSDSKITLDVKNFDRDGKNNAFIKEDTKKIINLIYSLPNGLIEMSQDFENLPQTSLNLGVLKTVDDTIMFEQLIRSSIDSRKEYVKNIVKNIVNIYGGECKVKGAYPAWQYNINSALREKLVVVYKKMYGEEPKVEATHGGLECGLFMDKIKGLDAISIGPTLKDVHSINEKLEIKSVEKVYNFLKEVLMY